MAKLEDFLEIKVHNSYGDTFERTLEDPTCSEVVGEFVTISQQLGYPLGSIYAVLLDEAEGIKRTLAASQEHIAEYDKNRK